MRKKIAIVSLLLLTFLIQGFAQAAVTPELRQAADKAYQEQRWVEAAAAYRSIARVEEKNPGVHYRLGISLLAISKNEEALRALQTANAVSPNPIFGLALARTHARLLDKNKMYETLEATLSMGGIQPSQLHTEKDFDAVRNEARFVDFVKRADLAANPCKARPEHRQFDFWVGEWNATNAAGLTVGTSSIQLILADCVIFENWNTPVGSGKSFSNYNTKDGKWHQTWVTDKGGLTYYLGGFVDGKMVLDSESIASGKKTIARMTFTRLENGNVRQHGEATTDDGKSWTTTFDFTYVRKQ